MTTWNKTPVHHAAMKGHVINITTKEKYHDQICRDFKCVKILNRGSNNNTKLIALVKLLTTNQIAENSTISRNSERLFGQFFMYIS